MQSFHCSRRLSFLLGAMSLSASASTCPNVDLTQSTMKGIPILSQKGGTCYANAAATIQTALIQRETGPLNSGSCSPLEMAASDRKARVLKNPRGITLSAPYSAKLQAQLSGGELCQSLNEPLKRGQCCQKFSFEDDMDAPPEAPKTRGLIDGAWHALFGSEDLNSDILYDHMNFTKSLDLKLGKHNQAVRNLKTYSTELMNFEFNQKGWPAELAQTVQAFQKKYGVQPFKYDDFDKVDAAGKESYFEALNQIRQLEAYQTLAERKHSEIYALAISPDGKSKLKSVFEGAKMRIEEIDSINPSLIENVRRNEKQVSNRILDFFKNKSKTENCSDCQTGAELPSTQPAIQSTEQLFENFSRIDQSIKPELINEPILTLDLSIQQYCSKIPKSGKVGTIQGMSCKVLPWMPEQTLLKEVADSLVQRKTPLGLGICANRLFRNMNPGDPEPECGSHAVTVVGMKTDSSGACHFRIRNSWGSDCNGYPTKNGVNCIADGENAGDLWIDAKLIHDPKNFIDLEVIR